ncbi:MAG TPA: alkaline phosphatase family protein [Acidimicrobiia bacterium]|nr:alkaline phosphatase family protein [Acidimicrobiia bacterium]
MLIPSTTGRGLVNLVAEIEHRFTGSSRADRLSPELSELVPDGPSVCLALFDGLGASQTAGVDDLASSVAGILHAPFPTTTTVSLASVATGRVAAGHGVLGHLMWLPSAGVVTNVLKFMTPSGTPVPLDFEAFLPGPTLWERLREAGIEPVTVQPGGFAGSPLSTALYRGCRFEAVWSKAEWVEATVQLANAPGRFVFAYWPDVDVAAHVSGRASAAYARTVTEAGRLWQRLCQQVEVALVGTADHGHLDYRESDKTLLRHRDMESQIWFGDSRSLMARGDVDAIADLLADTQAQLVLRDDFIAWFGHDGDPHPELDQRMPDVVALAADRSLLLPRGFDKRLVGYHGGLTRHEVEVPLLVGGQRTT